MRSIVRRVGPGLAIVLVLGISLLAGAAFGAGGGQAAPSAPAAKDKSADLAAVAETRTYLQRLEKLGFAGVVLVARGDEPLLAEGYGLADRERGLRWTPGTVSDIGSITKQFTAAAILKLQEDRRLSVSDPISRYFDGVPA